MIERDLSYYDINNAEGLLGHMMAHDLGWELKRWLIEFCTRQDAQTIGRAVRRIDHAVLQRRLARALARG